MTKEIIGEDKLKELVKKLSCNINNIDYVNELIRQKIVHLKEVKNRNTFIERSKNVEKLVYENKDINYIINYYKDNYDIEINELLAELIESHYYIIYLLTDKNNNLVSSFKTDNKKIEKLFIRLLLLKEGWNYISIERFIKRHYNYKYPIKNLLLFYVFITEMFNINHSLKPGRPSLPLILKEHIKSLNNNKNKNKINKIYKLYYSINNLFTKEEINKLIEDCKESEVIKKLETLKEFSS